MSGGRDSRLCDSLSLGGCSQIGVRLDKLVSLNPGGLLRELPVQSVGLLGENYTLVDSGAGGYDHRENREEFAPYFPLLGAFFFLFVCAAFCSVGVDRAKRCPRGLFGRVRGSFRDRWGYYRPE